MGKTVMATPLIYQLMDIEVRIQERRRHLLTRKLPRVYIETYELKYVPHYIVIINFNVGIGTVFGKKVESVCWKVIANSNTGQSAILSEEINLEKITISPTQIVTGKKEKEKLVEEIVTEYRFSVLARFKSKPEMKGHSVETIYRPFWMVKFYVGDRRPNLEEEAEEADKYTIF